MQRVRRGPGRRCGPDRVQRAGARYPAGRADGDRVPDDAPHLRVRAGHDRPAAAGRDRGPGVLRAERDRSGDAAGEHGRDRGRAGRGPDGCPAESAGLDRVRLAVPGPPGRGVNRGRIRGRAERRPDSGGRARHRRDPGAAHRGGGQRGRLREPARLYGADHARVHRRRGGPHLVRRRRQPDEALHHRLRDPGRLRRGPGPRRLRRLPQLRHRAAPASSSASLIFTGTSRTPTRSTRAPRSGPGRPATPSARPRPRSGRPGTPARPAWTSSSWTGCATATTRPSPSGSR